MMTAETRLTLDEGIAFETLIDASTIARYDSELERCEDHEGGRYYLPTDDWHLRGLLLNLWGDLITAEAIENAFARLTKDGAAEWPKGWCEEDDEDLRISELPRTEEDEAADWFEAVERGEAVAGI